MIIVLGVWVGTSVGVVGSIRGVQPARALIVISSKMIRIRSVFLTMTVLQCECRVSSYSLSSEKSCDQRFHILPGSCLPFLPERLGQPHQPRPSRPYRPH